MARARLGWLMATLLFVLTFPQGHVSVGGQEIRDVPPGFGRGDFTKNFLLNGCYSGDLHGSMFAGEHYSAVMVICFDGAGGVVRGRVRDTVSSAIYEDTITFGGSPTSNYSVDLDGLGTIFLFPEDAPRYYEGSIAVASQGKIVKVEFHLVSTSNPSLWSASVAGELVKQ